MTSDSIDRIPAQYHVTVAPYPKTYTSGYGICIQMPYVNYFKGRKSPNRWTTCLFSLHQGASCLATHLHSVSRFDLVSHSLLHASLLARHVCDFASWKQQFSDSWKRTGNKIALVDSFGLNWTRWQLENEFLFSPASLKIPTGILTICRKRTQEEHLKL